jgi:hypothetical protein
LHQATFALHLDVWQMTNALMLWQPYLKVFQILKKMKKIVKTLVTMFYECFFKHFIFIRFFFKSHILIIYLKHFHVGILKTCSFSIFLTLKKTKHWLHLLWLALMWFHPHLKCKICIEVKDDEKLLVLMLNGLHKCS